MRPSESSVGRLNFRGRSHFRGVVQSFMKTSSCCFDVSVSTSVGETGWLARVARDQDVGASSLWDPGRCGVLGVRLPGLEVIRGYPCHPGSSHWPPWPAGSLLCGGCWGFCKDLCIFRALTPISQTLGISSSSILPWKLPLAMGNCFTLGAAHPLS